MMRNQVQTRDEQRLRVLRALYERANGSGVVHCVFTAADVRLSQDEFRAAVQYLDARGFLEANPMDGPIILTITCTGIDVIESTIRSPDATTASFSSAIVHIVNNYFERSNIASLQQGGTGNSACVAQSVDVVAEQGREVAARKVSALQEIAILAEAAIGHALDHLAHGDKLGEAIAHIVAYSSKVRECVPLFARETERALLEHSEKMQLLTAKAMPEIGDDAAAKLMERSHDYIIEVIRHELGTG